MITKKQRANSIAGWIVGIYTLLFLFLIMDDTCLICTDLLLTVFIISSMTMFALQYAGLPGIVVWTVLFIEVLIAFFLIRAIAGSFISDKTEENPE